MAATPLLEARLRDLARGLADILGGLEVEPGRYRMSPSAPGPSLDATSLGLDLERMLGLGRTEAGRDAAKAVLDGYQREDAFFGGFFCEPEAERVLADSPVDRVLEMHANYITFQAAGAYAAIDRLPARPVRFYDQFLPAAGGQGLARYLTEHCPWHRSPWGAGGMVDNLGTILDLNLRLGLSGYRGPLAELRQWLDANRDPETGLWGSADVQGLNGQINGAYHLMRGTYCLQDWPFGQAERIVDAVLADLAAHPAFTPGRAHGCQDLDHFFLLEQCAAKAPGHRTADVRRAARARLAAILEESACPEGGFSFEAKNAVTVHNYLPRTSGKKEPDLLGCVFYGQALLSIGTILGLDVPWASSSTHGLPASRSGRTASRQ
ncbi:hypothetical protein DFW101_3687 (plasmid) [Solidesulfovibrio carbinoliphilus subsp. oakridgensis]|uniref:Uncharacterized protein n=1 Tax=Solidesulfovibrio carbinoliphilus subsp. oakridgensis TaxID=694327 RepID=G7QE77_9BACT|nr:hypothetical protein [Solidesulfovibrio carbinoliphilus]EHJ45971.1 hypothetical protein DFW101_3687 [Solidesulfovibrio carbinoliphilus subsp. oakridgensis]